MLYLGVTQGERIDRGQPFACEHVPLRDLEGEHDAGVGWEILARLLDFLLVGIALAQDRVWGSVHARFSAAVTYRKATDNRRYRE